MRDLYFPMLDIKKDYSLKKHNSFLFSHKAQFFCEVKSKEESHEFIDFCLKKSLPISILGEGTNVVFTKDVKGGVIKISIPGKDLKEDEIIIGAGENWHQTVLWALENSLFGLENLTLIPGTAGAAPVQNIGAYGEELSSRLISLEAINTKNNELISISNTECDFSYRDSRFRKDNDLLITSIKLRLKKETTTNTTYISLNKFLIKDDIDPSKATPNQVCRAVNAIRTKILPDHKKEPNVGSFFKNLILDEESFERLNTKLVNVPFYKDPENLSFKVPVAFLIEQAGWKGKKIGKVRVSHKHALVLITDENAESEDLTNFAALIIEDIYNKHGVKLEIEPNIF